MVEAVIYTVFAIFAVYGMYTAAREVVLFLQRLSGKKHGSRDLCGGCRGCCKADPAEAEENKTKVTHDKETDCSDDKKNTDSFRT